MQDVTIIKYAVATFIILVTAISAAFVLYMNIFRNKKSVETKQADVKNNYTKNLVMSLNTANNH